MGNRVLMVDKLQLLAMELEGAFFRGTNSFEPGVVT